MESRFFGAMETRRALASFCLRTWPRYPGPRPVPGSARGNLTAQSEIAFSALSVDAVLQSHAHIDHSGKFRRLVREGFRGALNTTRGTRDLCKILWRYSAHIQVKDALERGLRTPDRRLPGTPRAWKQSLGTAPATSTCWAGDFQCARASRR